MTFHTFGDSHSTVEYSCWGVIDGIKTHYLGPMLAYTFGNDPIRIDKPEYEVKEGDIVCFCFGEIDCRCHVKKHTNHLRHYRSVIDEIVALYFNAILIQPKMHVNICVFNVPPPIRYREETHAWPYVGTDEERKAYHEYFNERLKEECKRYGYIFFDVYDKYTDDEGFLRLEDSDNNCHIKNGEHVKAFYDKLVYG